MIKIYKFGHGFFDRERSSENNEETFFGCEERLIADN